MVHGEWQAFLRGNGAGKPRTQVIRISRVLPSRWSVLVHHTPQILSDIDRKYSVKPQLSRGRSIRARYTRVTADERLRRLRFSPFPSLYTNKLKNLRSYIYRLLNDNCIVLATYGSGRGKRKIYMLPKATALTFTQLIDDLNKNAIAKMRDEISKFRESDDYLKIMQVLARYHLDPSILKTSPFTIGDIIMDIVPVVFDYDVSKDVFLAKEAKAGMMRGLELLRKEVDRFHREYVVRTVRDIVSKLMPGIERLSQGRKMRGFERKIDKLMRMCSSLGLEEVNAKLLSPLKHICKKPKKVRELSKQLFGTENLVEAVRKTVETLS